MGSYLSAESNEHDNWKSDARYAMESGAYCVICGAPFDLEGDVYNLDPKEPRYQWLYDFRLLGYVEDVHHHRVTSEDAPPVNTSDEDGIFLSEKCWYSVTGSGYFRVLSQSRHSDIWFDALLSTSAHGTLFPLHEACIETSKRVIDHKRHFKERRIHLGSLEVLCDVLNTNWQARHAAWLPGEDAERMNDIFDLCASSSLYGPRSVLAMTRLEWWGGEYDRFYTNPVDVPDRLSNFVFNVLLASSSTEHDRERQYDITREPHGIERLPAEILDTICAYVPARTVIALHRASKILAVKLPLDNTFWRDRLRDGSLHPQIWDLDTKRIEELRRQSNITFTAADWDWRSVAKLLAMKRFPITGRDPRLDDLPHGLWNRCRIWCIIEDALTGQAPKRSTIERCDSMMQSPIDLNAQKGKILAEPFQGTLP